ncbi:WecB/TagA/CpsF family glycosyltransferase [Nocardioides albus]|uniref:N-acetylglucosaminyldiphosphoundecaprenol N-acetyl-beta-D-mannosaminyltransferase n=1 Tax=Nocardioides albus TaxID=1841 RepID=A0A7W5A041_9ACTN|nr:WecB/TagA/CpsF family glycosyltransferase [Nocardioides albus]MBB3087148.1 N-acetylglucosaminyldiphosphoundecaprenol N-acetyl-beta-D-mannosaminyltransferase [Nocardioides albus]GGU06972.1 UDP-N-acetyl-D-mannosamine transferase [Nocardioides albus]
MTEPRAERYLFGLRIAPLTLAQAVERADEAISGRTRLLVAVVNAAKIAKLTTDTLLRESLLEADVTLADGQSVVWASRILRQPLPERVAGIDLFEGLLDLAHRKHLGVYLLGARPEVLAQLERAVAERWPGLELSGTRDGYFTDAQSADVAAEIREAQPDMLFLGITTPKKEIFLGTYADELGVPVMHGVGGSFDVLAGVTRRAPRGWQRLGMEWAYRVLQEPRRLWRRYLVTNLAFLALLTKELVRPRPLYPRSAEPNSTTPTELSIPR